MAAVTDNVWDDVGVFAERVLRRALWDHQLQAARSGRFITSIAAARRTGKTTLVETLAIWTAFRERGVRVVILSATQDSARRVTENIGETLASRPETRGAVVDDFATRIRLANGSEIVSLPASPKQVRGYGRGVKLLVIDEAGFVANELWQAAHYIALDERRNGARVLLTGTPWGGPELFFRRAFEAGRDGDREHASFQWTHEVNPLLDHAYLERQRDRVAPSEYAAEVLGEWSDAAGSLFPRELLARQSAPMLLPALGELRGPAAGALGFDHGVGFDRSAVAVLYRLPVSALNSGEPVLPRFVAVSRAWPVKTPMVDTVREVVAAQLRAPMAVLSSETNGVGAMPTQEVRRLTREAARPPRLWNPVATSNASKTAGYGALLALLERGQLILPSDPELLRQLAGLRFEQGERGFTRIGAEDAAVHDDVADALMLATGMYRGRRGLRCALLEWASPDRAPADASVGALADPDTAETVQSGGGLRVWRRPPLQSVDGSALSWPDGRVVAEPEPGSDEDVGREWHIRRLPGGGRFLTRKTEEEVAAATAVATPEPEEAMS